MVAGVQDGAGLLAIPGGPKDFFGFVVAVMAVGQHAAFRQDMFNGLRVFDYAVIVVIVDLLEYVGRKCTIECCKTKCIFTESIKSLFAFITL